MARHYAIHKGCGGHLGGGTKQSSTLGVGRSVTVDYTPICEKCGKAIKSQWEIDIGGEVTKGKQHIPVA